MRQGILTLNGREVEFIAHGDIKIYRFGFDIIETTYNVIEGNLEYYGFPAQILYFDSLRFE